MADEKHHEPHPHEHGPDCEHTGIKHEDHVDYLHDGHMHHVNDDGSVSEHAVPVSDQNPDGCNPVKDAEHDHAHQHGPDCGHEQVPHGDHVDYLVVDEDGKARLHHPHGDHCDDHGPVDLDQ